MVTSPLIITVAPNGARKMKEECPHIPITPDEIAAEAKACRDAGAVMIHLHVRNAQGGHTLDALAYREAINAIRRSVGQDLIIQVTTESVGMYAPIDQIMMVRQLQPEAVSIAVREFINDENNEEDVSIFFNWMASVGIAVQYILYSAEEVALFNNLCQRNIIPPDPKSVLFVLGKKTINLESPIQAIADPKDLHPFVDAWDSTTHTNIPVAICAFGNNEQACMLEAVNHGLHTRIGFENNHYLTNGLVAKSNAALVEQLCSALPSKAKVANVEEARKMLGVGSGL